MIRNRRVYHADASLYDNFSFGPFPKGTVLREFYFTAQPLTVSGLLTFSISYALARIRLEEGNTLANTQAFQALDSLVQVDSAFAIGASKYIQLRTPSTGSSGQYWNGLTAVQYDILGTPQTSQWRLPLGILIDTDPYLAFNVRCSVDANGSLTSLVASPPDLPGWRE